ncbi:MAG: tetratricopeptide repeat protein [bacterium]
MGKNIITHHTGSDPDRARRATLLALFFGFLCLYSGCSLSRLRQVSAAPEGKGGRGPKANVLLITIDTLRADHLGCYGYGGVQTPSIDGMARSGVQFTHAYTPVPITLPSHTTIMTGQYPIQTGVRDNGTFRVSEHSTTLARALHQHGYRTAAFVSAYVLDSRYGLDQGFDSYDDALDPKEKVAFLDSERSAEQVTQSAMSWISRNADSTFFTWVHYFDPHANYHPPSPFAEQYKGHPYDGEIAYTDHWIGVLLDHLQALGILDDTLVVLTSDHGEGLGEHSEKTHAIFIYDTTLHVPLIMRYPKKLPEGKTIAEFVRTLDIMPTILPLAGLPTPDSCEGIDLTEVIQGKKDSLGLSLYLETLYPQINHGWSPLEGIRTRDWKYILAPRPELYHLARDPSEMNNLAGQQADNASWQQQWAMQLEQLKKRITSKKSPEGTHVALDPEAKERLRSLGYVWTRSQEPADQSQDEASSSDQHPASSGTLHSLHSLPDPKDMIKVQDEIDLAASWINEKEYEKAKGILVPVSRQNPADLFVRFLLGQVYTFLKEWDLARMEFLQVINRSQSLSSSASAGYADARICLALVYLEQGEYEKAIGELTRSLESNADHYQIFYNLGLACTRLDRPDQALTWFDRALVLKPDQPDVHNNRGVILAGQGKIKKAVEAYRRAIELDRENPRPYQNLAALYRQQGEWAKAGKTLDQALRHNPDNPDLYSDQASLFIQAGEEHKAWPLLDHGLKLAPRHAGIHNNRGILYLKQQHFQKAGREFEQAIQSDPNYGDARYNLARLYEQDWERSKDPALAKKAIECYEQLIRIDPDHTLAQLQLAGLQCRLGDVEGALDLYEELLKKDPNNPRIRLNLGIAYGQEGRIDEAISEYRHVMQLDPNNAESCFNLGVACTQKHDLNQAVQAYQKAILLRPEYLEAYLNLGVLLWRQGLIEAARSEWGKVLQYDPQNAKAHCNLGNLALSRQNFTEAAAEYQKALKADPQSPEAHFGLGAACVNLGKVKEAVQEWQKTVALAPDNIEARMNLAVAFINQGDFASARTLLSQVLQLNPGLVAAYQLIGKMEELEKGGLKK